MIIHQIEPVGINKNDVRLYFSRIDNKYPYASGNKFYKLRPHLEYAKQQGLKTLLSFGGAYSNHIHALALFARQAGLESIGIIRGESAYSDNPTLQDAQAAGMKLKFVSRAEYRRRYDEDYLLGLKKRFPDALLIPEGGSSQLAISGCARLAREINAVNTSLKPDVLAVACGTGATLAGLVCGMSDNQLAIGYAVLRDKSLHQRVQHYIENENGCWGNWSKNYKIETADFGGYAKLDLNLLEFILDWLEQTGILLDPVYTGKACMRLMQQIEAGEFASGTSITMIHSGGIQGWRGMREKVLKLSGQSQWDRIEENLPDLKF